MARVCEICGKKTVFGRQYARRGLAKKKGGVGRRITGKSKRTFQPNIQRVRALIDGKVVRIKVCTKCIRAGRVQKAPRKIRERVSIPEVATATVVPADEHEDEQLTIDEGENV